MTTKDLDLIRLAYSHAYELYCSAENRLFEMHSEECPCHFDLEKKCNCSANGGSCEYRCLMEYQTYQTTFTIFSVLISFMDNNVKVDMTKRKERHKPCGFQKKKDKTNG